MHISSFFVYKISVLYLIIPIIFFFLGWLQTGIGLFLSIMLLAATNAALRKIENVVKNDGLLHLSKEYFIAIIVLFLFLLSTGNTGFLGCWGVDIPWRNAIYQDLIRQQWPIVFEHSHSMLCYYMTFWLVPAEITSLLCLNEIGSNAVLLLWMYIGLCIIFFLLCDVLRPKREHVIIVAIVFLFFSGINTIGMVLRSFFIEPTPLISNYPGWAGWEFTNFNINGIDVVFIIRNTYLNLADAYNQYFAIAIATILFFRFRYYTSLYAFIGLIVVPFSPIGLIGILVIEFLEFAYNILKLKKAQAIKDFVSTQNILAVFALVPVFYFYYSMNFYASSIIHSVDSVSGGFLYIPWNQFSIGHFIIIVLYYYIYFLIYARLIYDTYRSESIFWIILFCLITFPFFKIGNSADFNFTATISPYLILCILIIKYLLQTLVTKNIKIKDLLLIFFLSIAALTPTVQIASSLRGAYINDSISYKYNTLQNAWSPELLSDSFQDKEIDGFRNFLSQNYEHSLFFKYFSKNIGSK